MLAHYGVDILDPHTTARRIDVLARRLPPGSLPGDEADRGWTVEAHLLASLIDAVQILTFVTVRAAGGKPGKPKPYPRPRVAGQRPAGVDEPQRIPWRELGGILATTPGVKHG